MATESAAGQPSPDPAPSLEDRLGALMGVPEDPPEGEAPAEPEAEGQPEEVTQEAPAETFDLEVDGEKFTLPKKLEKGFLQERDYTQKSMALADLRKSVEVHHDTLKLASAESEFRKSIDPELKQLDRLDSYLEQAKSMDWASMSTDDLIRNRAQLDQIRDQRESLQKTITGKEQEWGQSQAQKLTDIKARSLEIIKRAIPNFSPEVAKAVRDHALSQGYTDSELANIFDPRHAIALWKAQQFDALKAKAQPAVKDAKTIKTGPSNPMSKATQDKLAYRKALQRTEDGTPERKAAVTDRIASIFGG
jgi:hypothetical protein